MAIRLFGKNKETVVNGAVGLVKNIRGMIDDSTLTAEERVKYNISLADATAEFAKSTLNENTERSRTRRAIAVTTIYFFYFLTLVMIVLWKYDSAWFDAVKELLVEFKYPTILIMIMAFFFTGYYLNKFVPDTGLSRKERKESKAK